MSREYSAEHQHPWVTSCCIKDQSAIEPTCFGQWLWEKRPLHLYNVPVDHRLSPEGQRGDSLTRSWWCCCENGSLTDLPHGPPYAQTARRPKLHFLRSNPNITHHQHLSPVQSRWSCRDSHHLNYRCANSLQSHHIHTDVFILYQQKSPNDVIGTYSNTNHAVVIESKPLCSYFVTY